APARLGPLRRRGRVRALNPTNRGKHMTRIQSFVQYELPKQLKGADSATATGKQAGAVESKPVEAKSIDGFDRGGNFTTALGEGGFNPPGHVTHAIGENGEGLNLQGGNGGGNFTTALGEGGFNPPGHVTHAIGENGEGLNLQGGTGV